MSGENDYRRILPKEIDPRGEEETYGLQGDNEILRESINQDGILTSLLVRKTSDGLKIIDGDRRLRAAIEMGIDEVPCVVIECDERKAEALRVSLERMSRDMSIEEVLEVFHDLLDKGLDKDELKKIFGEKNLEALQEFVDIEKMKKETEFDLDGFGDDFFPEDYIEAPPFLLNLNLPRKKDREAYFAYIDQFPGDNPAEKTRNMLEEKNAYELCNSEDAQKQVRLKKWT
ncbi:MAG: ParB/RepB/Spo0J family partition protein [Candidatus Nanohalobium sp.]